MIDVCTQVLNKINNESTKDQSIEFVAIVIHEKDRGEEMLTKLLDKETKIAQIENNKLRTSYDESKKDQLRKYKQKVEFIQTQIQKYKHLKRLTDHVTKKLGEMYQIEHHEVDDEVDDEAGGPPKYEILLDQLIGWDKDSAFSDRLSRIGQNRTVKRGILIPILTVRLLLHPKMTQICHAADERGVRFLPILFEEDSAISHLTRIPWQEEVHLLPQPVHHLSSH